MADHHHHEHGHSHGHGDKGLGAGFGLITAFAVIEFAGGWWSGSLALLSDAGHMFSDAIALGLAVLASRVARRPPSARHSYGLARTEVLAALFNGALMLALTTVIGWQAIVRLLVEPQIVAGEAVSAIALAGLIVNIVVVRLLHGGEQSLNRRAAMLHVLSDLLASVAALVAGLVIMFTGWMAIDPLLSLLICVLLLVSGLRLLREVMQIMLEGVPSHIDLTEVGSRLAHIEGVRSIHDLHIWMLSSGRPILTAHVDVDDLASWPDLLSRLRRCLHDDYGIDHITLQPETPDSRATERIIVWHSLRK